ncbi:ROK family transcriptional regulator [Virgibacillus sp. MSJ-26]|uniref:ROK family transcriptional regulator n=1 Tax=Virgibacillus sp. MSJ-26 TaxID=2841522 RepID=UPI001C104983|nr:ROK family transcriptional regulator [Virgibacillus sp. MSJ-26]MBU5465384.1 ROK family transcriptional regulator [Virgibacillus sp. MSJ-26]
MQRGTFQLMKSVNKSIILNKIRTSEPISRAQIAKETKLTPPTVSSIVRELIEQDLVKESELGESKGGRKPTMLLVNKDGFYVIGVDAGPKTIECILSNLSGQIKDRVVVSIESPLTNESFLDLLKSGIRKILQNVKERSKVLGIGMAMHGVVDVARGTSLFAPILQLSNIPIKDELEREFDLVVQVENDARAMTLGESWFGEHGDVSSMMAVNLGSGVGAGVAINGKLYHGSTDLAGEVGHMTIDMNGERCECGNRGCLESFASAPSIVNRANKRMPGKNITSSREVYELALENDKECVELLQRTGAIIGIGLTNLIHVLNPELIIIGGGVSKSERFILRPIRETISMRGLTKEAKETRVVVSELGDDATILGAVALLLVELFDPR